MDIIASVNSSVLSPENSELRQSKFGYKFDIFSSLWKLDGSISIRFSDLENLILEEDVRTGYRRALADFAIEMSAHYTSNIHRSFIAMIRTDGRGVFDLTTVKKYLACLSKENEYKLGSIKSFLSEWFERGYSGIQSNVINYLNDLNLAGNRKGIAVLLGCPHSGAYSNGEQQAILEWANNAFREDIISLEHYALLLLMMYTGIRTLQARTLVYSDLTIDVDTDGSESYNLKIPKAKQRNVVFREVFIEKKIDKDLALLLINQREASLEKLMQVLKVDHLPDDVIHSCPLFFKDKRFRGMFGLEDYLKTIRKMPDFFFITNGDVANFIRYLSHQCTARTTRLDGEFIHLTARRFRYSVGTNLHKAGFGAFVIAEALGHSDIQNVKVYTENSHEVVDLIDEAMATALAPLAQAFAGTLIASEADAIRATDPHSRVKDAVGNSLGNCGEMGFCSKGSVACYTCTKFQPWLNAPHQKMLDQVLAKRERQRDFNVSEKVIQATDSTILAITQVIQMVDSRRSNLGEVRNG
jgi:integrase